MNFKKWLKTFVEEKGIQHEHFTVDYQGQLHIVEMDFLIDFLSGLDKKNQDKIKLTIIQMDFLNKNVMDFMKYCAEGYIQMVYANEL